MSTFKELPIYRPAAPAAGEACHGSCGCGHGHAEPTPAPPRAAQPLAPGHQRSVVRVAQMDCPVEVQLIEHALGKRPEVVALSFNLLKRQLTVDHQPGSLAAAAAAILKAIGIGRGITIVEHLLVGGFAT